MWNRKELKEQGKASIKKNYWKSVLAGLILTIALGAEVHTGVDVKLPNINLTSPEEMVSELQSDGFFEELADDIVDDILEDEDLNPGGHHSDHERQELKEKFTNQITQYASNYHLWLKPVLAILGGVVAFAGFLGLMFNLFLLHPLEVGGRRFFLKNLKEESSVKEYGWSFSNSYLNIVGVMFFRTLYTFLWSLLLVIPGIVKSYEYRMVPYILAEDSEVNREDAFARSKEMMRGNKWEAFVLDLSFLGWNILNAITMGILGLLYTNPYQYATKAALYEALKTTSAAQIEYDNYVEVE